MQALAFAKPVEWVFLAVSLCLTWRYGWVLDDAFVYFRYVDNWLFLDRGLVFNPGEFVEGYTSPLWVLWLAAARLTQVDYWTLVRAFSVVFATCFWAMCVVLRRRLTRPGPIVDLPLAVFVTHYGVQSYFSSGLETPLVQLLALCYALLAVSPRARGLAIVAGFAPIVRPDLALPWLVYVIGSTIRFRRLPLWLILSGATTTGGWLLFRVDYYADLLPNTYYLKDETDLAQGFAYLVNTLSAQWLGFLLIALAGLAAFLIARGKQGSEAMPELNSGARMMMLAAALVSTAYVWRAGGDMLYYRFLAFPVILALSAFHGVAERALDRIRLARPQLGYPLFGALAASLLVLGYPGQLRAHPFTVRAVHGETMHKVDGISDASWHRYHPEFRMSPEGSERDQRLRERYRSHVDGAPPRFLAEGLCVRAFFAFDANVVHSWGLTEPVLARTDVRADRPGHKYQLLSLARDLQRARQAAGGPAEPGLLRRASERHRSASWIDANLATIEIVERKMYNQHRFWDNLRLATTPVAPITLPGS